mgnify:CR=1 FL=1
MCKMSHSYKITVFTPTYNRAYIIENLYQSLRRQTYRGFEWLVVDDGSTDDTEALFERLKAEANFPIQYYKKPNGGKHTAINMGLEQAQGELFFTVDSDDYLTDDALEKVARWEMELPKELPFCGFAGRLADTSGQLSGKTTDIDYFDGTTLDRYSTASGERAMVFYTDIHKKYPYPVFPGERFMTEAVTWNRMARDGYRFRFYSDVIWIYEYRKDGLTNDVTALCYRNPMGYGLCIREKSDFLGERGWKRFMTFYSFCCEMKELYTPVQLAAYLGIPVAYVRLILTIHKLRQIRRHT